MRLPRSPLRGAAAGTAASALTAAGLLIDPPPAVAGTGPPVRVDAALLDAVDGGGGTSFLMSLKVKGRSGFLRNGEQAAAGRSGSR
ncbi:hypothetical protein AB0935_19650 [Streptomyces sp. NPDC007027]|uniref:hypothetical protein n=1 Tax=Streptomyces sp. NPDC007027 TaxID=3157086 RepID=UPI003454B395